MNEDDTAYCSQMVRHGALGSLIGGPLAAAIGWLVVTRVMGPGPDEETGSLSVPMAIALSAIVLIGVWLGATLGCTYHRMTSGEEVCYAGTLGCMLYFMGGILGVLVGPAILATRVQPIVWYLIGGSVVAFAALLFTLLAPGARSRVPSGKAKPVS